MTPRTRRIVLASIAVVLIVAAAVFARWVVLGGAPESAGSVVGVRPGSDAEGSITGYHYRTTSRFGEYVTVTVREGEVSVAGSRVSTGVYTLFIGLLMVMWALAIVALVAAVMYRRWRWAGIAVLLCVAQIAVASLMAGSLWEMPRIAACSEPGTLTRVTFPTSSVKDVRVGAGWSRQGIGLVIWPVARAIDGLAAGRCVSFLAPDPTTKRDVVYAVHCYTDLEAQTLASVLRPGTK
ncbi:MAG: hypothetical protein WC971_08430 [Coriobacteriia bacterium]